MANGSQSQHRCVFVGNIPYDATEQQLLQICEEVGPVVSFRLVTDRETGKPKGFGFCEYKDEETALSARRNLQGYEINGRQLRVDFADNDKNADRNRDQGRGGLGIVPNVDTRKQVGGLVVLGDPDLHQPVGDSVAIAAATLMAGALGAPQTATMSNQVGLQSQSLGADPLTRHLAKMSKGQLTQFVSEMKGMATQNKEQTRQLLLASPNLSKALFQAQIILGMVPHHMLQVPGVRQSHTPVQILSQTGQTPPGLPLLPQNKMQSNFLPNTQESLSSSGIPNQYAIVPQVPMQSQVNIRPITQNGTACPPDLIHPQFSNGGFQPRSSASSAIPDKSNSKVHGLTLPGETILTNGGIYQTNRPSKMAKMNDGRHLPSSQSGNLSVHVSVPFPTSGISERQIPITGETTPMPEKQMELPADVDSALLRQVLNLTPEQLNSLPPDQRQQVVQLQLLLKQEA